MADMVLIPAGSNSEQVGNAFEVMFDRICKKMNTSEIRVGEEDRFEILKKELTGYGYDIELSYDTPGIVCVLGKDGNEWALEIAE